jgi:hypothetical protein
MPRIQEEQGLSSYSTLGAHQRRVRRSVEALIIHRISVLQGDYRTHYRKSPHQLARHEPAPFHRTDRLIDILSLPRNL